MYWFRIPWSSDLTVFRFFSCQFESNSQETAKFLSAVPQRANRVKKYGSTGYPWCHELRFLHHGYFQPGARIWPQIGPEHEFGLDCFFGRETKEHTCKSPCDKLTNTTPTNSENNTRQNKRSCVAHSFPSQTTFSLSSVPLYQGQEQNRQLQLYPQRQAQHE